jgi:hypothetical protein
MADPIMPAPTAVIIALLFSVKVFILKTPPYHNGFFRAFMQHPQGKSSEGTKKHLPIHTIMVYYMYMEDI